MSPASRSPQRYRLLIVQCPTCREKLEATGQTEGREIRCPHCRNVAPLPATSVVSSPNRNASTPGGKDHLFVWFILVSRTEEYGPVSEAQLRDMYRAGTITAGVFLRQTGKEQYITAGDLMRTMGYPVARKRRKTKR